MTTEQLEKLALEQGNPCVSISLNTHRTRPDNAKDAILLKNLIKEAEERLLRDFNKREVISIIDAIKQTEESIDVNQNLDSLHIFVSANCTYVYRSPWPTREDSVRISDCFYLKHLIKNWNNTEDYLILLLSQSGVSLFSAINDKITDEVRNWGFPFSENPLYITNSEQASDSKQGDKLIREYFNRVDKAVVKAHNELGMHIVAICTPENYTMLMQVADKPSAYFGFAPINYNDVAQHTLVKQAWSVVLDVQKDRRTQAVEEMKQAVGQGKVVTDLNEIYRAINEGRGELLIAHDGFTQAVRISDSNTLEPVNEASAPNTIDDITGELAWNVIAKKGRALFTQRDDIKSIGDIALKLRY